MTGVDSMLMARFAVAESTANFWAPGVASSVQGAGGGHRLRSCGDLDRCLSATSKSAGGPGKWDSRRSRRFEPGAPDGIAFPAMRVGVISDTHGLLRPRVLTLLHGCDRILHAGDLGGREVLARLREIARVEAVRGNVDSGPEGE